MDTLKLVFTAAEHVLIYGFLLGAGLPVIFAVGVRALAGVPGTAPDGSVTPSDPGLGNKLLAYLAFGVVIFAVIVGIMVIVGAGLGMVVTFDNLIPSLEPKN
jgi:hypothetical protein